MNWIVGTAACPVLSRRRKLGLVQGNEGSRQSPDRYDRPIGVGRREHERRMQKRYRRRRVLLAIAGIVGGAVGGFTLLLIAALRRWFR